MEKIMILNGSPRAPRSNSKQYAALFEKYSRLPTETFSVTGPKAGEIGKKIQEFSHVLLVFPLYADGLPVPLLRFLKEWEQNGFPGKPTVSVLINCGFLEPEQNDVAIDMVKLFCRKNGLTFGSVLKIGSGEAILQTPFRWLVERKIRRLAANMEKGTWSVQRVTMPLTKNMFLKASTKYWESYGKKNGITRDEMATMSIEKETNVR